MTRYHLSGNVSSPRGFCPPYKHQYSSVFFSLSFSCILQKIPCLFPQQNQSHPLPDTNLKPPPPCHSSWLYLWFPRPPSLLTDLRPLHRVLVPLVVRDVLVGDQEENHLALLILDGHDIQQTPEFGTYPWQREHTSYTLLHSTLHIDHRFLELVTQRLLHLAVVGILGWFYVRFTCTLFMRICAILIDKGLSFRRIVIGWKCMHLIIFFVWRTQSSQHWEKSKHATFGITMLKTK